MHKFQVILSTKIHIMVKVIGNRKIFSSHKKPEPWLLRYINAGQVLRLMGLE